MCDLAKAKKSRGFTRTRITKTLSKCESVLLDKNVNEVPALLKSLRSALDAVTFQNQEVLELLEESEVDDDIETSLEYELKVESMIQCLNKSLKKDSDCNSDDRLFEILQKQNEVSLSLAQVQERSLLPQRSMQTFDGTDVTKFKIFKNSFLRLIEAKTSDASDRLYYLEQYTSNMAQELVRSCFHMNPETGYRTAWRILDEKYGDEYSISTAFLEKLECWPEIKKEDGESIEKLSVFLQSCLNYMDNVSAMHQLHSPKEIKMIVQKLPYKMREAWRSKVLALRESGLDVSFADLVKFVDRQAKLLNMPVYGDLNKTSHKSDRIIETKSIMRRFPQQSDSAVKVGHQNKPRYNTQNKSTFMTTASCQESEDKPKIKSAIPSELCPHCKKDHALNSCESFLQMPVKERRFFIRNRSLCFKCLIPGHHSSGCKSQVVCGICHRNHATVLHENRESKTIHTGAGASKQVALALIPVRIRMIGTNKSIITYAGLDNCSSDCFVTEKILSELGIRGMPSQFQLTTLEKTLSPMSTRVVDCLEISDLDDNETVRLPCTFSRPNLPISTEDMIKSEDMSRWSHLADIPIKFVEADVGLLIGINVPEVLKPLKVISGAEDEPFATKHKLGWAISGPVNHSHNTELKANRIEIRDLNDVERNLKDMYNSDFRDTESNELGPSVEDKLWERKVSQGKFQDGHYVIPLPFRDENPMFPDNRGQAIERLKCIQRRLQKDPSYLRDYAEFMKTMIEQGFMQPVPSDELKSPANKTWYLTHHGVYHKEKQKVRVVFDCSLKYKGISLNSMLLQGPDLTNSLLGVLLRFRQGKFAISGDIEKMFYQVKVPEKHYDYMRLFWFPDGDIYCEPKEYRLTVHVFGAISSPSCANFALRQSVLDGRNVFSDNVTQTVLKNFYVDDLLKSTNNETESAEILHEVKKCCSLGGFRLTKFISNSQSVIDSVDPEDRATDISEVRLDLEVPLQRALGMKWDITQDTFSFKINLNDHSCTRRGILSIISSVYDPLGLVGPAVLPAKRIFQTLSVLKLNWDDPLPESQRVLWDRWLSDLQELMKYKIPRCILTNEFFTSECSVHIFCDGSEIGYGAVAYARFENANRNVHCSIVYAKSRLAPIKKTTIPRMELTAAKLAVTMKGVLDKELDMNVSNYVFWTDSTTVLKYLNNTQKRFHRFVANRLTFIHERSSTDQWQYVPSKENPADHASRGLGIDRFVKTIEWKNGPDFLWRSSSHWPKLINESKQADIDEHDPEVKRVEKVQSYHTSVSDSTVEKLLLSSSDWYKLKRKVSWIMKIKECLRTRSKLPLSLTVDDIVRGEFAIIEYLQRVSFNNEIQKIKAKERLPKTSPIYKLNPFIDNEGILRVGGRISSSATSWETKHPIILPKNQHVSELIVKDAHLQCGCMGRETVLSRLRTRFWIVGANLLTRRVTKHCFSCRKRQGKPIIPLMADLPPHRLEADSPPFTNTGIDCFGPFEVVRFRKTEKRYGVIFTCLVSRAIHIEVATSLETDSFINALRRFIARRGNVQVIRSDNGTNFVGAERELKKELKVWNDSVVSEFMLQKSIEWKFNPPTASHFGGVWEREIRSIRKVLSSVMNEQRVRLSDDSLNTLLCEVESILNNRPLTAVSDDPNDLEALTPNHLLLLNSSPSFPPGLFSRDDVYVRRRWRQVQYLADLFWYRWKKEYLTSLQKRYKWNTKHVNCSVGDLVLLIDQNLPRNQWPLGRIVEVHQSHDDEVNHQIRVVTVRVVNVKTLKELGRRRLIKDVPKFIDLIRPISKLVPLRPFHEL